MLDTISNISLNTFDIITISLITLLGLKGLFKGFIKEIFGIIGIVGGVFISSRLADQVGSLLSPVFSITDSSTATMVGFIVTLVVVWISAYISSYTLQKLLSAGGLGGIDKLFGFIFGAGKILLILSIITYGVSNIEFAKSKMSSFTSDSVTYPLLYEVGGYIVKLDFSKITDEAGKKVDSIVAKSEE
jgi:membrane protein required for colicin V production